jgi:Na+/H+ antiporter NhaD/arsenite permease-like protein
MRFLLITILTLIVAFLLNPISKKVSKRVNPDRFTKVHIHHSVWGVLLFVIGIIIGNDAVAALGLGIYLGHVAEEVYFNKRNVIKAFFILVTR